MSAASGLRAGPVRPQAVASRGEAPMPAGTAFAGAPPSLGLSLALGFACLGVGVAPLGAVEVVVASGPFAVGSASRPFLLRFFSRWTDAATFGPGGDIGGFRWGGELIAMPLALVLGDVVALLDRSAPITDRWVVVTEIPPPRARCLSMKARTRSSFWTTGTVLAMKTLLRWPPTIQELWAWNFGAPASGRKEGRVARRASQQGFQAERQPLAFAWE